MTLPGWCVPLLDAERVRAADRWAIEEAGVPSLELMERASAGLADLVMEVAPQGRVVVVCGAGNNGGDGYAAARLLRGKGREVLVLAAKPVAELSGDAMTQAGFTRPIDMSSTRAGTIPGIHTIGFDSSSDTIELTHTARDRRGFAIGALLAARWIQGKQGWYSMQDVLRDNSKFKIQDSN